MTIHNKARPFGLNYRVPDGSTMVLLKNITCQFSRVIMCTCKVSLVKERRMRLAVPKGFD